MARRDLSRTVIEGGRARGNKQDRRASHGIERARTREWLGRVSFDHEEAEDTDPRPRDVVYKNFRDKLGPAKRWLAAQVGRPWADVFSEVSARFDTRTIAGRHVVHDHMLGWVYQGDVSELQHRDCEFEVDERGILRRAKWFGRSYYRMRRQAIQRVCNRRAVLSFRGWWWYRRDLIGPLCITPWQCKLAHHHDDDHRRCNYHGMRLVADRPITRGELRWLDELPSEIRNLIVIPTTALSVP